MTALQSDDFGKAGNDRELSQAQLAGFEDALKKLRRDLIDQERHSAGWRAPVELDQQSVGRLSRIDAMQQQAMSEAEARRRAADIHRIDATLLRIADGEYGWCGECGEIIAPGRLNIEPMATLCVGCAT